MQSNDMAGIQFKQPKDFAERFGVAEQCSIRLDMKSPVLIDNIANTTCEDYAAFPDRLYIIDMDGKVSYKGGRGPFGYKPKEMEQSLLLIMMEAQIKARKKSAEKKTQVKNSQGGSSQKHNTPKTVPPKPADPSKKSEPKAKAQPKKPEQAKPKGKKEPEKKGGKPKVERIVEANK